MKNKIKKIILPFLPVFVSAIFPVLFMYFQNIGEVFLKEIWRPLGTFLLVGAISYVIISLITKSTMSGGVLSVVIVLIFSHYRTLETMIKIIFPKLRIWHIVPMIIVVFLLLTWWFGSKISITTANNILKIVTIAFTALILVNILPATPKIINTIKLSAKNNDMVSKDTAVNSSLKKPNIYYILTDEFSGFESIKNTHNYNNDEFKDFLENRKFTVSIDSHNESILSNTIISNLISLDYIIKDGTSEQERNSLVNPPLLYSLMEKEGYEVVGIGETQNFYLPSKTSGEDIMAVTAEGDTFESLVFDRTPLYPLYEYESISTTKIQVLNAFSYINNLENMPKENTPTFTFFYIVSPHAPFVFNADGGEVHLDNAHNWVNPKYFVDQYKYITGQLQTTIDFILKNDPNCVIVLQSDHSARALREVDVTYSANDKSNILNAVYFGGESLLDINGQSGVNTWRIIINKLFNKDYPLLEVIKYEE